MATKDNLPSALGTLPPPVNATRTKLTDDRVRTVRDVVAAWGTLYTADLERSRQRAMVQSAVDGAPPYSDAFSRAMGTWGRSNFNPGLARRSTFKEQAPYNQILEEMDILISLPTRHGSQNERNVWEPILAEEFTRMLKTWPKFNNNWQQNVSLFVREGVSICCWEDEHDWRPSVYGLQHFKFPEGSAPCEDELDMCGWKKRYNCRDLYKMIQNEKMATKMGWNVKAVTDALKQAVAAAQTDYDWEFWEKRWKAQEVMQGSSRPPQVECIHLLVKEINGTVTHLISPRTPLNDNGEGPLFYERRGAYSSMTKFMTLFTYGVGTNGDLHSIRGHTSNIFNAVCADARTINSFVDAAVFSATPLLECANDDAMSSIPLRRFGSMTMVQQGNTFKDVKMPSFTENLIPLHALMTQLFEGESSGASMAPQRPMERKTNLQEVNESMAEGQLTTAAMALFFPAQERHLQEICRRTARKNYRADEPGGEYVWKFRNRLKARKVPLEALYEADFDGMEVNTGVGKGSQRARMAAADRLMENYYLFDDQGKNECLRLNTQVVVGARKANSIVPPIPGLRPGQQVDNADDQNGFLTGKNRAQILSVKVRPDQNSAAHVKTHMEFLAELWPMTGEQDQRNALDTIMPLWSHTIEDLQGVYPKDPLYGQAKKQLNEYGEWVLNTAKELAAEEDRTQDQAARDGTNMNGSNGNGSGGKDVGGEGPNTSNLLRAADASAKLQYTTAANQVKLDGMRQQLAFKAEDHAMNQAAKVQDMNLKNAEAQIKRLNAVDNPK